MWKCAPHFITIFLKQSAWPHIHKEDNCPGTVCIAPHHESPGESFTFFACTIDQVYGGHEYALVITISSRKFGVQG